MNIKIRLMQTGEGGWYAEASALGGTESIAITLTHKNAKDAIAEMDGELVDLIADTDSTRKKWLKNMKEQGLIPQ